MQFEGNPFEFTAWAHYEKLGTDKFPILIELSRDIVRGKEYKRTKGKGEIAKHYQAEFQRMQALRAKGETGRIEFTGWL